MQSAVNGTLGKSNSEMQTFVNIALKTHGEKLYERVVEDQNSVNLKFNQVLNETTQNLLNDWNGKYEQLNNNLGNMRKTVNQDLETKLGSVQGSAVGNMDEVNRAIDNVKKNWQNIIDRHEQQICGLEAANKAMENEFDNMINIKVSNAVRNMNKTMGDKIREVTDQ